MKKREKKELTIESISYIHDPDSAQEWFEIYLDIVKKELLKQAEKEKD